MVQGIRFRGSGWVRLLPWKLWNRSNIWWKWFWYRASAVVPTPASAWGIGISALVRDLPVLGAKIGRYLGERSIGAFIFTKTIF